MSREDRDPATWTRGEVWDAYQLAVRQGEAVYRENIALRQRMAKIEDVARLIAEGGTQKHRVGMLCNFCLRLLDIHNLEHEPNCPVVLLRALLAEPPIRPRLDYGAPNPEDGGATSA